MISLVEFNLPVDHSTRYATFHTLYGALVTANRITEAKLSPFFAVRLTCVELCETRAKFDEKTNRSKPKQT